ncbi:V-type ATP synthase subunit E [Eubacterium sp.]|uniref:V-type ATP synthase subunit E n=1 Tax=Eubacterium sp. TaxID=142586 RepID=UPI002FCA6616
MASDKIVAKIIENAENDAKTIRQEAQDKAQTLIAAIDEQTGVALADMEEAGKKNIAEIQRRSDLMTRLENRKKHLLVKQSILDETFKHARMALDALSGESWEKLITRIVLDGASTGREQLQVPQKDRERYMGENGMLKRLNTALKAKGLPGELTLSEDDAAFKAGVRLIGERFDVNGSFDRLIDDARITYEREAADILFPAEV